MSILLLNVAVILIFVGIAIFLTLVAIVLIIVSLVRSASAKKKGKKTRKVGLWIGIAMLVIPWICVAVIFIASKIYDSNYNRWTFDRENVPRAIVENDTDYLWSIMAEDVMESNDLSKEDLEDFLDQCNIDHVSSSELERYTDMSSPDNHYRTYTGHFNGKKLLCFQYTMYNVNDDGGELFITGVDGDQRGDEFVGIYFITYSSDSGESLEFGERPPKEK